MILEEDTFNELGKFFKNATNKMEINCRCDYCNEKFNRKKKNILTSHRIIQKDACNKKECRTRKREESNIKKYGVRHPLQNSDVKEKVKQTCLENFGVENPSQNKEIREKIKQTNLKNLGVENPSQNKEIKEKIKQTNLENLGVEYPSQNKEIREKSKKTCLKNLGVEYSMQSSDIREKSKKTCLKNLNTENPMQNKDVREKHKQTCLKNFGVENPSQNKEIREKAKQTCLKNFGVEYPSQNKDILQKTFQKCIEIYGKFPANSYGKTQKEIQERLNSFGFNFNSDYTLFEGKEIDLYDPNIKVAIEYCGLFWHAEDSLEPRTQYYHYEKYKKCLGQDVQLLTIFSDEWLNRQKQCIGHVKSVLGIVVHRIYARKCQVKEITKQDALEFFDKYHIQGSNNLSIISYGLFYEDKIVGAISLGNHHRQNVDKDTITLDRLCFEYGVRVVGGASKLFKKCKIWAKENNYKKIISFSDNRWSLGKVYEVLGFSCNKEYGPDYSYVDLKKAHERLSKQSQKKNDTNCPKNMTELEWANERGLSRIWDCGKKKWIIEL